MKPVHITEATNKQHTNEYHVCDILQEHESPYKLLPLIIFHIKVHQVLTPEQKSVSLAY